MGTKEAVDFFFEMGHLKLIKHEGWRLVGVDSPDSVAEHSLRAAQIGFILARMEGYENPYEVCTMLVFHDCAESRVGDLHLIAKEYVKSDQEQAVNEQLAGLGESGKELQVLWKQVEERSSEAGRIARDADELEQALCAREYMLQGFHSAKSWLENIAEVLHTDSARALLSELEESDPHEWWKGIEARAMKRLKDKKNAVKES